ncbi:MAG: hypothetical protein LUH10_16875 [Tannerellaceae bacterium]|nr:hypothetical protein [Tannerellaceae bacterium]
MKYNYSVLLILCLIFIFSCTDKETKYMCHVNDILTTHFSQYTEHYENIIIIPRQGCNACISTATNYFDNTKHLNDQLFIFTRINSKKQLGLEIGAENFDLSNVVLDFDNCFYVADFPKSNYPLHLKKEQNQWFLYKVMTP